MCSMCILSLSILTRLTQLVQSKQVRGLNIADLEKSHFKTVRFSKNSSSACYFGVNPQKQTFIATQNIYVKQPLDVACKRKQSSGCS